MNKQSIIVIIVVFLAVAVAAGFLVARKKGAVPEKGVTAESIPKLAFATKGTIGSQIFEKSQNPIVDKLPETNPFGADTNPFEKQANPLKTFYKNPFQ